jgi:hypothetical protein
MFLNTDKPDKIMCLVDKFPKFLVLYRHIYEIWANTEDILGIFSEELAEMDRNTVNVLEEYFQKYEAVKNKFVSSWPLFN